MIIKSLELHNFRQFMDDEDGHGQKIIFSTDPDKKATLFLGFFMERQRGLRVSSM